MNNNNRPHTDLTTVYLSLASLQQFPSESVPALRAVRGAAHVAASSIWCPQCGAVAVDNPNPPIETFQNTMLLGTILPIIANGYQKLLRIIDDETNAAEAAGQTKTFRFRDYGGMCGQQVRPLSYIPSMPFRPLSFSSRPPLAFSWRLYDEECM